MSAISELFERARDLNSKEVHLERNNFLIRPGEIEKHIYLVQSGSLRVFLVSEHEEQTIRFGYRNSIITALPSFITGKPNDLFIQALKKTTLKAFHRDEFFAWINSDPELQNLYTQLMMEFVIQLHEREVDLLTQSPSERYRRVLSRSPQVFQEIPSKYIAAYLRMTPETLSRLKKN